MAYDFNGSDQGFFVNDAHGITAPPFTMNIHINADSFSNIPMLFFLGDASSHNDHFLIYVATDGTVNFRSRDGGGVDAPTTTTASTLTNHVLTGRENSSSSRDVFLDGGGKGSNTDSRTPDNVDRVAIGYSADASPTNFFNGRLWEAAIWNVALTDAEIAWLGLGYSALTLTHRIANLQFYKPMIRGIDTWGIGSAMSAVGATAPTIAAHGPVIMPSRKIIGIPVAAAPPVGGFFGRRYYDQHLGAAA